MAKEYPKHMWHRTVPGPPRTVEDRQQEEKLGRDWTANYQYQEYPRVIFHPTLGEKTIPTQEDFDRLEPQGWSKDPSVLPPKPTAPEKAPLMPPRSAPESFQRIIALEKEVAEVKMWVADTREVLEQQRAIIESLVAALGGTAAPPPETTEGKTEAPAKPAEDAKEETEDEKLARKQAEMKARNRGR